MQETNEKIDRYLDKLFKADSYSLFVTDLYEEVPLFNRDIARIDEIMQDADLISQTKEVRKLTTYGEQICNEGGWLAYLKSREKQAKKEKKLRLKEEEMLEYDLKVSKYLYKTRWLPHILALISLVISIIAFFKSS
ncbi:MAG: hypothetical protein EX285_05700 [Thaumarchaeota archaeon]|nr:hypothetical protein [Nitrososphaerota archaeon]